MSTFWFFFTLVGVAFIVGANCYYLGRAVERRLAQKKERMP